MEAHETPTEYIPEAYWKKRLHYSQQSSQDEFEIVPLPIVSSPEIEAQSDILHPTFDLNPSRHHVTSFSLNTPLIAEEESPFTPPREEKIAADEKNSTNAELLEMEFPYRLKAMDFLKKKAEHEGFKLKNDCSYRGKSQFRLVCDREGCPYEVVGRCKYSKDKTVSGKKDATGEKRDENERQRTFQIQAKSSIFTHCHDKTAQSALEPKVNPWKANSHSLKSKKENSVQKDHEEEKEQEREGKSKKLKKQRIMIAIEEEGEEV